ncbi:hypothetical protein TNCT_211341 [Trichonephila clavata]|uniref:Uncharacterized protein n=1 Tax=Trichonephila clavata TaxID=2740835 RepID=A0A8X6HWM1_TRICU|nr:hypothetical protein TNCT_211341 [Trichonephila clavata]
MSSTVTAGWRKRGDSTCGAWVEVMHQEYFRRFHSEETSINVTIEQFPVLLTNGLKVNEVGPFAPPYIKLFPKAFPNTNLYKMQSNNHLPAERCSHEQPVAATQTGSTCCNFIPLFNQICPSPLTPGASLVSSSSISSNVVRSSAKDELCEGRVPVLH